MSEQVIRWKLDSIGMNPTAESYLLLHRFGTVSITGILRTITEYICVELRATHIAKPM